MSGIKNIKKKLKGFQVRPPNVEVLKKVLLHIPYVVVFYVVNKCTWLYQYCRGSTVVDRLMVLFMNYPLAFKKLLQVYNRKVWQRELLQQSVCGQWYISRERMERSFARERNMALPGGEMKRI